MPANKDCILTINGGSSSIKFALYQNGNSFNRLLYGEIERIGISGTSFRYVDNNGIQEDTIESTDYTSVVNFLIDWLEKRVEFVSVNLIGHRIVHGMKHTAPMVITTEYKKLTVKKA
jgi:acetate kinase